MAIWLAGEGMLEHRPTYFYETISLLAATTAGLYFLTLKTKKTLPGSFVQVYLGTLVIKILAFGAYIFVVVLDDASGAMANAIFFLSAYLLYTILEVSFLYFRVRQEGT
jgi:hypothetical protein